MPLPENTVTKTEFETLMSYVTLQRNSYEAAEGWANSGLQYVVLLQRVTPEVDLLQDHASHFLSLENLNADGNFTQVVNSMNRHVVDRGTTADPGETNNERLNRWLWCQGVKVTRPYKEISDAAGWNIDWCNVRSDDADADSQMGEFVLDDDGNVIAVGCTDQSIYKDAPTDPGCPTTGGDSIGSIEP